MTDNLRERVARAICRADCPNHPPCAPEACALWRNHRDGAWEAIAVVQAEPIPSPWLPLPPVPVEGVAPWDGRAVLLCYSPLGHVPDAYWSDEWGTISDTEIGWRYKVDEPTHWQPIIAPLPSAPLRSCGGEVMTCACMGPQNGQPLCPCRMREAEQYMQMNRAEQQVPLRGCVCPPGAEATCQGWNCPRRAFPSGRDRK